MTPDPLIEAGAMVKKWTLKRDKLIAKARATNEPLRAIAARAGVSHQQVKNISQREAAK